MNAIEAILANCPYIPAETKYWFVRTDGGDFYPGFIQEGVIGLDYSEIAINDLALDFSIESNKDVLKRKVAKAYPEHGQQGNIVAQLIRFKDSMKNGDYVIIPGWNTKIVAIGQIEDETIIETEIRVKGETGDFQQKKLKTKKVRWIKSFPRTDLHPRLHLSFWSHQAIVDVTKQSEWVDSLLYDYYRKGNEYNYVIRVGREGRIPAREVYTALNTIMDTVEAVATTFDLKNDVDTMGTSINLNSKGPVRFISLQPSVAVIGLILIAFAGGANIEIDIMGQKVKAGFSKTMVDEAVKGSEQIMKIIQFIRENDKEDELKEKLKDLEVEEAKVVPIVINSKRTSTISQAKKD